MLRRVAFRKAALAGATGAVAWDLAARLAIWAGLPLFDLVHTLGTLFRADTPEWQRWPLGLAMHAAVGVIWAIFYAYFFWSTYDWKPIWQGIIFSLGPAVLAGLIMIPQMGWMHPRVLNGDAPHPSVFAWRLGWGGPAGVLIGHLIYGAVIGSLYVKPVGYPVSKEQRIRERLDRASRRGPPLPEPAATDGAAEGFMFATGIECSYPTIDNGRWRVDQMEETGHYRHWLRDLELVRELGIGYLRYGPPLHHVWPGPEQYDWAFTDAVMNAMRKMRIRPIVDMCHFGLPDWLGNFQNPEFPQRFAGYAAAFAGRYPWVNLFTPINEMYVTARMSALDGVWNEQLRSEAGFATAVRHLAKANLLASEAILRQRPDAIFINSESGEFFQPCCPDEAIVRTADFENQRRFIALDLAYGVPPGDEVREYLFDHGMSDEEYQDFIQRGRRIAGRCVLGVDYYEWNEKLINSDGRPQALGELFGWYVITKQYYDRYRRPLMHTETNCQDAKRAPDWLWRQWHNVQLMRHSGVSVIGFTWYSLIDQVDWNVGLGRSEGNVNPVGLFDLNRDPRPVAESYRRLIEMFGSEPLVHGHDSADLLEVLEVLAKNGGAPLPSLSERTDTFPAQPSIR